VTSTPQHWPESSSRAGGSGAVPVDALRAWLYEVDQDGMSRAMKDDKDRPLHKAVRPAATLRVSVKGGYDSTAEKHLWAPSVEGMAVEPVTVYKDAGTGFWTIRNSGKTNTLRVQQYGLGAVPLHPGASMAMPGEDVAVWIPVKPAWPRITQKSEAFRLLILRSPRLSWIKGDTTPVSGPRHFVTPAAWEALIMYFGQYLSWPALVMPHVRGDAEVKDLAVKAGLERDTDLVNWARNRHDVLTGRDGLFTAPSAAWYPRFGGADRALGNHLAAFHRLVELGTINLTRARKSAKLYDVNDFLMIDTQLADPL